VIALREPGRPHVLSACSNRSRFVFDSFSEKRFSSGRGGRFFFFIRWWRGAADVDGKTRVASMVPPGLGDEDGFVSVRRITGVDWPERSIKGDDAIRCNVGGVGSSAS